MDVRRSFFGSLSLSIPLLLAACAGGISGEYGGEECIYDKLDFRGDGTVYVTFMGTEQSAEYTVDGDKISIGMAGQGLVFTRDGNVLEATIMGETMRCEKM